MVLLFGSWSSFCQSGCVSFWDALGLTLGGNAGTVVGVHPAQWCTPFRGVLLAGLGASVGDCRGGAVSQNVVPCLFPGAFWEGGGDKTMFFLWDCG